MNPNQWYGWVPDKPDFRDKLKSYSITRLPESVDLRPQFQPPYDQGQLGSCTANTIAGVLEFNERKQGEESITPSRLFIYYNERDMEGTVGSDSGAALRDGIKSVNSLGAPPESEWPYNTSLFTEKPPYQSYQDAILRKSLVYERLDGRIDQLLACLANGFPFAFGFSVYDYFESQEMATTGILRVPTRDESIQGGHAVVGCGYDEGQSMILVRNSWGTDWGQQGYFWMPFDYITNQNLADDFWTIQKVT